MRPPDNPYSTTSEETAWKVVKMFFVVVAIATVVGSYPRDLRGRNSAVEGDGIVMPAEVRPARLETVTAKYPGRIIDMRVKVGQGVEEGQLIMVLRNEELEASERSATLRLKLAEGRLGASPNAGGERLRREQEKVAETELAAARRRLAGFSIAAAENAARQARSDAERVEGLMKRRLATAIELEAARDRERATEQARLSGVAQAERLRDEVQSYESQLRLLRLAPTTDPALGEIDRLNAQEARAGLASARKAKAALRVVAPFRGVVLAGVAELGDEVLTGAALAQIGDLKELEFRAVVPGNIAKSLSAGALVRVRIPSDPPQWIVSRIDSVDSAPNLALGGYGVRVLAPGSIQGGVLTSFQGAIELPHVEEKKWRLPF